MVSNPDKEPLESAGEISIDIDFICDQQPSSTNNCLDNTELLPKQQEHSCPDQWSYMLAEQLCPLSNLQRSLCHNEIWSSSCNAKCCFACEMPVLISLFEESEFLNHEEENTTYNWVFFQLRNGGCWNLFPSAWQGSWIDFKMRNSWQLGAHEWWWFGESKPLNYTKSLQVLFRV